MDKQTGNYNDSINGQNSFNQSSGNGGTQNARLGDSFDKGADSMSGSSGSGNQETGLSNLAYNWISFVQCKADAVKSYQQYISDAEEANSSECADMFREACKADQKQLEQAKQHLSAVLQGTM